MNEPNVSLSFAQSKKPDLKKGSAEHSIKYAFVTFNCMDSQE